MRFLDASLFIYLLTADGDLYSEVRELFLDSVRRGACTDALAIDEFMWVCRRRYGVPLAISMRAVRDVILPTVELLEIGEAELLEALSALERDLLDKPSDAIHYGVMRTHGVSEIVTEDRDFERLPGVTRIWLR